MTVVVLSACPIGLRGQLTRWLLEIAPGVFVGNIPARVRELLWIRVVEQVGRGRALLVHSTNNEQGLGFKVHGHDWLPVDYEGIQLMMRPQEGTSKIGLANAATASQQRQSRPPEGWSKAARRKRYRSNVERQSRGDQG